MNAKPSDSVSTYQQYLPAILQKDEFFGQFLLAFEQILSGLSETPSQEKIITANTQNITGLEEVINNVHLYFNPQATPEEFLPWLARWVSLSLRDDWQVEVKKAFIQQIVRLYNLRGTKAGLIEILSIYLQNSGFGEKVEVFDQFDDFPHYFQVQLTLKDRDPDKYWRQAKIAKAIIDQEKPAQTFYALKILVPTMQLTKRSHIIYTYKLFAPPQEQKFAIAVTITPNNFNSTQITQLAKQLLVQIQGNSKSLGSSPPEITSNNQSFSVKQNLTYQHLQDNLAGFNVTLSNRTDKQFQGNLAIDFHFYINDKLYINTLLEQPINLAPVLTICRENQKKEIIAGNTIFQKSPPRGMKITESMWTKPDNFKLFTPPQIQELTPQLIALIEKIDLEAIVEITQPNPITSDVLNKITVRLQDNFSDYDLLIPETIIANNQITIKRTFYYQQFLQNIDMLALTIKSLHDTDIAGKVTLQATLNINQRLSTHKLLEQSFNLTAVPAYNILQICQKNERGEIIFGQTIPTILGTTTQSLN
ncbi:phage tail protein I [Nostoc sp. TCL26-01]|uniref:phage tail protein I n=1 Tax=Nostoc sp. TCL26-01 TaxID=2576904 RepID=UPI0015C0E868|nr:phage tail protein I [Nostoc sp. TCL26-01]QLE58029.1 phage tail protein I [Nostoc sp. TCL26-01]